MAAERLPEGGLVYSSQHSLAHHTWAGITMGLYTCRTPDCVHVCVCVGVSLALHTVRIHVSHGT